MVSKWSRVILKDIADLKYGKSPKNVKVDESNIRIYGTSGASGFASEPLFNGPIILVGRKGTIDTPIYIDKNCWIIDTAFGLTVKDYDQFSLKWLYYFLLNFNLSRLNEATGVPSLSKKNLDTMMIELPTMVEQHKIAAILSTVDEAIEQTEAIIEQTEKVKKGLMQQLLTKGIGHTKFKKTEIGEIPEEWKVVMLSDIAEVERGKFTHRPRNDTKFYGGSVPFVQTGDVTRATGILKQHSQTLNQLGLSVSKLFPVGTIIMTIAANIGETAVASYDVAFPDSLVGIKPIKNVNGSFLEFMLRTKKGYLNSIATKRY